MLMLCVQCQWCSSECGPWSHGADPAKTDITHVNTQINDHTLRRVCWSKGPVFHPGPLPALCHFSAHCVTAFTKILTRYQETRISSLRSDSVSPVCSSLEWRFGLDHLIGLFQHIHLPASLPSFFLPWLSVKERTVLLREEKLLCLVLVLWG